MMDEILDATRDRLVELVDKASSDLKGYPTSANGFVMPGKWPISVPVGYSDQHKKLGGKSAKTKQIRSETPRGFAEAVYFANGLNL